MLKAGLFHGIRLLLVICLSILITAWPVDGETPNQSPPPVNLIPDQPGKTPSYWCTWVPKTTPPMMPLSEQPSNWAAISHRQKLLQKNVFLKTPAGGAPRPLLIRHHLLQAYMIIRQYSQHEMAGPLVNAGAGSKTSPVPTGKYGVRLQMIIYKRKIARIVNITTKTLMCAHTMAKRSLILTARTMKQMKTLITKMRTQKCKTRMKLQR